MCISSRKKDDSIPDACSISEEDVITSSDLDSVVSVFSFIRDERSLSILSGPFYNSFHHLRYSVLDDMDVPSISFVFVFSHILEDFFPLFMGHKRVLPRDSPSSFVMRVPTMGSKVSW